MSETKLETKNPAEEARALKRDGGALWKFPTAILAAVAVGAFIWSEAEGHTHVIEALKEFLCGAHGVDPTGEVSKHVNELMAEGHTKEAYAYALQHGWPVNSDMEAILHPDAVATAPETVVAVKDVAGPITNTPETPNTEAVNSVTTTTPEAVVTLDPTHAQMTKDLGMDDAFFKNHTRFEGDATFITDGKGHDIAKIIKVSDMEPGVAAWYSHNGGEGVKYVVSTIGENKPFHTVDLLRQAGYDLDHKTHDVIYYKNHLSDDGNAATTVGCKTITVDDWKHNALITVDYSNGCEVTQQELPPPPKVVPPPAPEPKVVVPQPEPTPVQDVKCWVSVPRGGMSPDGTINTINLSKDFNGDGDFDDAGENLGMQHARAYFDAHPKDVPHEAIGYDARTHQYFDKRQRELFLEAQSRGLIMRDANGRPVQLHPDRPNW